MGSLSLLRYLGILLKLVLRDACSITEFDYTNKVCSYYIKVEQHFQVGSSRVERKTSVSQMVVFPQT